MERVVVVVHRQPKLPQVVGALAAAGSLAGRLHRGEEQRDEHADDRDDDQELDEREGRSNSLIPF